MPVAALRRPPGPVERHVFVRPSDLVSTNSEREFAASDFSLSPLVSSETLRLTSG